MRRAAVFGAGGEMDAWKGALARTKPLSYGTRVVWADIHKAGVVAPAQIQGARQALFP